jgi:hypothetical protein
MAPEPTLGDLDPAWSDMMANDLAGARVPAEVGDPTGAGGDPARRARGLIERLRSYGHHAEADHLDSHLTLHDVESGLLFALREACETVLTAIEAIDPVTQTMVEDLRLEVERRLRLSAGPGGA